MESINAGRLFFFVFGLFPDLWGLPVNQSVSVGLLVCVHTGVHCKGHVRNEVWDLLHTWRGKEYRSK